MSDTEKAPDGLELLRRAESVMHLRAAAASTSSSGRWRVRKPGAYPQEICDDATATLVGETHDIPVRPFSARHILAWDPPSAFKTAEMLKTVIAAAERGQCPAEIRDAAEQLAATFLRERDEDSHRRTLDGS